MSELNTGELLSAYLDGEVEGDELNRVNFLLASSAEARQELERLQETKAALSSAPRLSAPPDLVALLLAHPKLHERRRRSWWHAFMPGVGPRWVWAWSACAGVALAVFVTVTAPWAPDPVPLGSLLAAHARQHSEGGIHAALISASNYSAMLAVENEARP